MYSWFTQSSARFCRWLRSEALAVMAPERMREGPDARLLAGALVIAVLAVLAFTQRRASSTPGAARPAATPPAASALVADAGAAPASQTDPDRAPVAAAVSAPPEAAPQPPAPAASAPSQRAARAPKSKAAGGAEQVPIEALFETRR